MKKILSFLLALVMVLTMVPVTFPAMEVSAEGADATEVTLTVTPSATHAVKAEGETNYTLTAALSLSTNTAFNLGSLQFDTTPSTGVTLTHDATDAQIPVAMKAEVVEEVATGKQIFTWAYTPAVEDNPETDEDETAASTEIALTADTAYSLGTITMTSANPFSISNANLKGTLAGKYASAEENGTYYDLTVALAGEYAKGGHNDAAVTWTPITSAADLANVANGGHYYLAADVTATGSVALAGKNATVCLNGKTLTAKNDASLFALTEGAELTLCDCSTKQGKIVLTATALGGGAVLITSDLTNDTKSAKLTMDDVVIDGNNVGNSSNGSAIRVNKSGTKTATSHVAEVTLNNCEIKNVKSSGGAIFFNSSAYGKLTVNDSKFENNIAQYNNGGAIMTYANGAAQITVDNTQFIGNKAIKAGMKGGAICVKGGTTTITNSTFKENSATTYGGAIFVDENGTLSLTKCTLQENTAPRGGAIAAWEPTDTEASPAVNPDKDTTITLDDVTFEGNTVTTEGGAIHAYYVKNLTITDSKFTGNTADTFSGAIHLRTTPTTITNTDFTGNICYGAGPSVLFISESSDCYMTDCELTGNTRTTKTGATATTEKDGAIEVRAKSSRLYVAGQMIVDNNTDKDGTERNIYFQTAFDATDKKNALYVNGLTEGTKITLDSVDDRTADANKLLIATAEQTDWDANWVSYDQLPESIVLKNGNSFAFEAHYHEDAPDAQWQKWGDDADEQNALPTEDGYYYLTKDINTDINEPAPGVNIVLCLNGHTVRATGSKIYSLHDNTKTDEERSSLTLCDCHDVADRGTLIPGNGEGGVVYGSCWENRDKDDNDKYIGTSYPDGANVYLRNVNIDGTGVTSANNGVALWAGSAVITYDLKDCLVENCTTTKASGGGAMYISSGATLKADNVTFKNNQSTNAKGWGGALYLNSGTPKVTLNNCTFESNSAAYGGAIYANTGTIAVTGDSKFTGNTATNYGGVIYMKTVTLNVNGATFDGNHATYGGVLSNGEGNVAVNLHDIIAKNNTAFNAAGTAGNGGLAYMKVCKRASKTANYLTTKDAVLTISGNSVITGNSSYSSGSVIYTSRDATDTIAADGTGTVGSPAGITCQVILKDNTQITGNATTRTTGNANGTISMDCTDAGSGKYAYLTISDNVVVAGNTNASSSNANRKNVYLNAYGRLKVGVMGEDANVWVVTSANKTDPNDFTVADSGVELPETMQTGITYINTGDEIGYENGTFTFQSHSHAGDEGITWKKISSTDDISKLYEGGNFYLTSDLTLTENINLGQSNAKDKDITICLNGYSIKAASNSRVFRLSNGNKLTVCDCGAFTDTTGAYHAGKLIPGTAQGGAVGMYSYTTEPYTNSAEFTLEDGIIDGTGITSAAAGCAIYTGQDFDKIVRINGGEIRNCNTTANGAAVHVLGAVDKDAQFYMTGGKITNNTTGRGGVYYGASGTGKFEMTGGEITNNHATGNGGALNLLGDGDPVISGTAKISGNTSDGHGGAIYIAKYNTTVCTLTISGNAQITNNETLNTAKDGGAIYINEGNNVDIVGGTISGNKTRYGGAVCVNNGTLDVSGGTITKNTAVAGGAISVAKSMTVNVTGGTFSENTAIGDADAEIGANGGAILASGTANVSGGTFSGNTAVNGGAIYVAGGGTLNVTGGTFSGNTASSVGGAIGTANSTALLTITGTQAKPIVFNNNKAGTAGAVVRNGGNTTISYAEFTGNEATASASALFVGDSGTLSLNNITVQGNTAPDGAVHLRNAKSTLNVSGKTIIDGNTDENGKPANVYLCYYGTDTDQDWGHVNLADMDATSKIGVTIGETVQDKGTTVVFSEALDLTVQVASADETYKQGMVFLDKDFDGKLGIANDLDGNTAAKNAFFYAIATGDGQIHDSVEEVLESAPVEGGTSDVVTLNKDLSGTEDAPVSVTLPATTTTSQAVQIDLNGTTIGANVKLDSDSTTTLYVADSKLDYNSTEPAVIPANVITNNVTIPSEYKVGNKRYVAIEQADGSYEIHRVQLTVTAKALRPSNDGIGFKVKFSAASSLTTDDLLAGFGINFTVKDGNGKFIKDAEGVEIETKMDLKAKGKDMENGQELTIVVAEFLTNNEDLADYTVVGTPFITLGSGEQVIVETTGKAIEINFKDMVQYAENGWSTMKDAQKNAIADMYNRHEETMSQWTDVTMTNIVALAAERAALQ